MQLVASTLLFTQRFATVGALVALPIITTICAFCWSTGVYPTAMIATLMLLGTVGLVLWDLDKWRGIFVADEAVAVAVHLEPLPIDMRLWTRCGIAMLVLYLGSAIVRGGVYRPRGIELGEPAFYVMPLVMLLPILTFFVEQRSRRPRA
jgi:hypothetical protein